MPSYQLLDTDTVTTSTGIMLRRIQYDNGSLGGYLESEKNLDPNSDAEVTGSAWVTGSARVFGSAWVSGNARVYGEARVSGLAWVSGSARVFGSAMVYGEARVYGDAEVSGLAWVYGDAEVSGLACVAGSAQIFGGSWTESPLYIQGTRDPITHCAPDMIAIGCEKHTIKHWLANYQNIGQKHKYTDREIEEYRRYIELIAGMQEDK